MDQIKQYLTKKNITIGAALVVAVVIVVAVCMMKKEKYGSAAAPAGNLLSVDANGNLGVSGIADQLAQLGGSGDAGQTIFSTGVGNAPVWGPANQGSLKADGYQIFPGGFIIQWGTWSNTQTSPKPFPIPFPTACLNMSATCNSAVGYVPFVV